MVQKYKIYVNGKNQQPQNTANQQLVQQIAQNAVNQNANTAVPKEPDLRETVTELVKTQLTNPVDVPQFTTIQDILDAKKGDKLGVFAEYMNTPQFERIIGNFLPQYGYNPKTGRVRNVYEEDAQRKQLEMDIAQKRAIDEFDKQQELARSIYNAYNQKDIADENNKRMRELAKEEMEFKRQENALNRALQQQQLNATIAHQRAMEGIARERLNATNKQEKQLQKNLETLNSLNAIQGQLDRFSNSFKDVRPTKIGALVADAYAKGGFGNTAEANFNAQRTLLFNKIARELGGEKGVLSDQDIKRIESSLPALGDSLTQKKAKMQAIYNLLDDRKQQYGGSVSAGMASQMNNDPLGLGF